MVDQQLWNTFLNETIAEVPRTFRQYILRIYGHTRTHFQLLYGMSVTIGRKKQG